MLRTFQMPLVYIPISGITFFSLVMQGLVLISKCCKNSEYDQEYHNHKLQTNQWHHEEEPHSNQETPGKQIKQSNQLSLPHQDDCKTRRDIK